jgi:glutathione S-transferase
MITLYHAGNSVCSIKVRLGLEEAGLEWSSIELNLGKGEQFAPEYRALNPAGVVPTLIHDDRVLTESSIILDYVAAIGNTPTLIPDNPYLAAQTRLWGLRALSYHAAVNTISFASYGRMGMQARTPEEREAFYAQMPSPVAAAKRKDLVENGTASPRVMDDLNVLRGLCDAIEAALADGAWLVGDTFTTADMAVAGYIYRVDCMGLERLWTARHPKMTAWWAKLKARPSFDRTVGPWIDKALIDSMTKASHKAFLDDPRYTEYF